MAAKHLTESGWKALSSKLKIKDNGLGKALAAFEKLGAQGDPDARLQALERIDDLAAALGRSKDVARSDAAGYLDDIAREAGKARQVATTAKKAAAKAPPVDEDEEDGDLGKRLLTSIRKVVNGGGHKSLEFLAVDARPHVGIVLARRITQAHKDELATLTGSRKYLPVGDCVLENGKPTFVTEGVKRGFATRLKKALRHYTEKDVPLRVRDRESALVLDDESDLDDLAAAGADGADATALSKAQAGASGHKGNAPIAAGVADGSLVQSRSGDPPPAADWDVTTKSGVDINRDQGTIEGSAELKSTATDGAGGKDETGAKASAKAGGGGLEAGVSVTDAKSDAKGAGYSNTGSASVKRDAAGNVVVGLSGQQTLRDADGNETRTGAGLSTSGADVSVGRTERIGEEYGASTTAKGAVDWQNNEASAGIERKSQVAGDAERSLSADAKVKLGEQGGGEVTLGGSAGVGARKAGASVTIRGLWKITPEADGTFTVEYVGGIKGGVSGSQQAGKSTGANKGALSGTASIGHESFFRRSFPTRQAAQAFCKKHDAPPAKGADADIDALQAGDSAGSVTSGGLGVGASANLEGITVGATFNWGASASVSIAKVSDAAVDVHYVDLDQLAAGGSLGAAGLSMGAEVSQQELSYRTVRFLIDTADGRAAFEQFRRTGRLEGTRGYKVLKTGTGTVDSLTRTLGIGPATIRMGSSTSSSQEIDALGRRVDIETGTEEIDAEFKPFGDRITLPGGYEIDTRWLSDWHKEKHSLNIRAVNGEPTFVLNTRVDSKGARGAGRVLANVTNSDDDSWNARGESAGGWSGEMPVSLADMEKFSARVLAGDGHKYGAVALGASRLDTLTDLQKALRAAKGDGKAWYQALTAFFAATGDDGIRLLEVLIGRREMEIELDAAADKDNVWLNLGEFEQIRRQLKAIEDEAALGRFAESMRVELAEIRAALKKKGDLVTNDSRYKEVPKDVKKRYSGRLKELMAQFKELQARVQYSLDRAAAPGRDAVDAGFVSDGRSMFKALEKVETGVLSWAGFARDTRDRVRRATSGIGHKRLQEAIDAAIEAGDQARAGFADARELSERGVAELEANPCQEAFANLSGAVTDARKLLATAYAEYRKAVGGLQQLRELHHKDFQERFGGTSVRFALEDFPKSTPAELTL
ncbi:MAG: hypothetical protein AB7Q97_10315 [Gammaproteobacteria bacterium]